MIDQDGSPRVVEFNVRWVPRSSGHIPLIRLISEVLMATAREISDVDVEFSNKHASTVVLASGKCPGGDIEDM